MARKLNNPPFTPRPQPAKANPVQTVTEIAAAAGQARRAVIDAARALRDVPSTREVAVP